MARLLSEGEIDALLEVEGESPSLAEFALAYAFTIGLAIYFFNYVFNVMF